MNRKDRVRRLLEQAGGCNDNAGSGEVGRGVTFNAPVTFNLTFGCPPSDESSGGQCRVLVERIRGFLAAQPASVAAAFDSLVQEDFGDDLVALSVDELSKLLRNFNKIIAAAHVMATTA